MATAVASKPSAPHQTKMKRPPLPAVQTNGIQSSQSSPSPLTSSKRPPSGFKAPPTPTLHNPPSSAASVQPRLSQRRKDSQKPGEMMRTRAGKDGERKPVKRKPEPYVKTQGYILKKYKTRQPSLIIHLHQNNFRFDQQTGSFSYTSPMRMVLEHLKAQTVPHDMIEELMGAGVPFYEGCLIVQVKDHRSVKTDKASSADTDSKGPNIPFSVHNYEQWLTPSPYVPFPEAARGQAGSNSIEKSSKGAEISRSQKDKPNEPKTYTIVLFPTPQSISEEAYIQANTPDSRPNNRRAGGGSVARTPSSATVPPTPLSAIPPTPTVSSHSVKRQKMSVSGGEVQQFESMIITATAPPLFLEPVDSLEESQQLIDALTDPLHREQHPSPKTRKRTVAELAADERIAAQEQAFMLIMDEKANNSGKTAAKDDDGTAPFEPNFESFNAIQQIKAQHTERMQHRQRAEDEHKRREQQARNNEAQLRHNRIALEQRELKESKERKEKESRAFELAKIQDRQRKERQQQAQLAHQQQLAAQNQAAQQAHANGLTNGYPPARSSPVVRNGTPHSNASPVIGNIQGGVPMQPTSSGQGSSPARPPSSLQHGHSATGGVQMLHQRSRQQNPSRTGTPQMQNTPNMANTTPNIPHSTPNLNQATPNSRMAQGSPQATMANGVNGNMTGQHINGRSQLTAAEHQHLLQHKARQQQFLQEQQRMQQHINQGAMMQQNGQMSPNGMPQNMQHYLQQQQRLEAQMRQQQVMNNLPGGHPSMPNGQHPQPQQSPNPHMGGQPQQNRPMPPGNAQQQAYQMKQEEVARNAYGQLAVQMAQQLGLQSVQQLNNQQKDECKKKAMESAIQHMNKMRADHGRAQAQMQQQAQIQQYKQSMMHNMNMQRGMQQGMVGGQQQQQQQGMVGMPQGMTGMMGGGGQQMGNGGMNGMPRGMTQEQMMQLMAVQQQQQQQQQQNGQMGNMGNMGMGGMH